MVGILHPRHGAVFDNNSANTLEEVVDRYSEFFKRVEAVAAPGIVPPVERIDGIHFDRRPAPEERAGTPGVPEEVLVVMCVSGSSVNRCELTRTLRFVSEDVASPVQHVVVRELRPSEWGFEGAYHHAFGRRHGGDDRDLRRDKAGWKPTADRRPALGGRAREERLEDRAHTCA